jgi:hypothetical protein
MTDFRYLLTIYVHAHETGNSVPPHIDSEARSALAQPETEPQGLTDDELDGLAAEAGLDLAWRPELRCFARFALARTAAAILQPIPVSKFWPWELDCDAKGRCWWGDAGDDKFVPSWRLCEQPDKPCFDHWLPHWALPVPNPGNSLRAARRPKPKSQAEKALASLDGVALPEEAWQAVSAALERLRELEKSND